MFELIDLCRDAERGLAPVAGGVLDQTQWFNIMRRLVRAEDTHWRAEKDPLARNET